jgi:phosphoribosyl-ATP pyrophosphohydrolase/phosphoribosyl-AMP cyclohydrolase/histidinol dehydrogenase
MLTIILANQFQPEQLNRSIDADTLAGAQRIVDAVRERGEEGVREYAAKFGERTADQPLVIGREELAAAKERIPADDLALLERVAGRIRMFATAQLESLSELKTPVLGGYAGHTIEPIVSVGCYAPAGGFALPSTVMMTVVPAVVADCETITLATPNPSDLMLAAAAVAGATQVLAVGGAQAIAAMAYGFEGLERCDLISGPGNRWVTAAKKIVNGDCGIDMLAGPSELVLLADDSADAETVAADLLGQAEHDADARPFLVTTDGELANRVNEALTRQLDVLPTAETARAAVANGAAIVADSIEQAIDICNAIATEHLELHCRDAETVAAQIRHAGCLFIGHQSAEVFGDYGVGPNHTLPTAGTSRWSAGLNVFTYVRIRTWLQLDGAPHELIDDTARLAELEGLVAHQRSALRRK